VFEPRNCAVELSLAQVEGAEPDIRKDLAVRVARVIGDPQSFFAVPGPFGEPPQLGEGTCDPGPREDCREAGQPEALPEQTARQRLHVTPVELDRASIVPQ